MQPNIRFDKTILRIAKKEITLFFSSPIAYLFLATFVAITLFTFFWGEAFFSRNISDVRPLFEWMPILLIFLSATLTMRLWSEERRSGTLEYVHTQAVPLWHFVIGKFFGCLFLLAVALAITLPLPITVANIGDLDWGPVWAGYLATLLLGATYLSIGLFVSARSDNQIVSLISASVLSGLFYLIGTTTITDLFSNQTGEWLRLLGTGSRFDSITRGVLDLRDLYYYLSIILVFLALNTLVLEQERWVKQGKRSHHRNWQWLTVLVIANAIGANLWLGQLNALRVDVTQGAQYSISDATHSYLKQLQEPLLIRGYFSHKTHPLLAPLVPQLRDLIQEYEIAGEGRVRIEFIDPINNPELEEEANQKYGIQPVPFQVADRYQASIVSSYFNVLIQYGDEHQILGFRDLIEIKTRSESDIDVQLRNPEHDLTRAVKTVLNSYQAGGNLFDTVSETLTFNAYFSADAVLPEQLVTFKQGIKETLETIQAQSNGRFLIQEIDPDAEGGKIGKQISNDYGFNPMTANFFSTQQFYFYMTLASADQIVQIPLDDMTTDSFAQNLDTGIKRFASGFTKKVALVMPNTNTGFSQLENFLNTELTVNREDLSDGAVSGDADILLLTAPKDLDDKQLFAIDQFLMQGGTVIMASAPYSSSLSNRSINLQKHNSGLSQWLAHHGLNITEKIVLDPQNSAFPAPVTRNVQGFQIQEMRMLDYPYFIDIRDKGFNQNNLITSELPQATLTWASPILIDKEKQGQRTITELLHSSNNAWLSSSLDIMPRISQQGVAPFTPEGERGKHLLGVISQGRFNSYFADKDSPLLTNPEEVESDDSANETTNDTEQNDEPSLQVTSVINHSPESARIILISSNDFLSDNIIQLLGTANQSQYVNTLQMAANAIDWALEDTGLLSIRSRGHFNRTLPPMEIDEQRFWEYLNYGLAALALIVIALLERYLRRRKQNRYQTLLAH